MIERQYIRQLNEAIQKSKTVDPLSDSMKNWKKAAGALTDAGEKWIFTNTGDYTIYSAELEFGFTCGEEDNVWEFFSAVGDEVKEFNSKLELLNFVKKLGLPTEGLFSTDEPLQSSNWSGDGYYFRYDITKGYIKVLVTPFDISVNYYPLEYGSESKEMTLALNATGDEIKAALKQVASAAKLDEGKISEIISTCPIDELKR